MDLESRLSSANALGDLDSDGDLDMVVGTLDGQGVHIFLNEAGNLTRLNLLADEPFGDIRAVALGDLNRDGWLDVIVANVDPAGDGFVAAYLNQMGAQNRLLFTPVKDAFADTSAPPGVANPALAGASGALAVGDLNGDQWLDVVVDLGDGVRIYLNQSFDEDEPAAPSLRLERQQDAVACPDVPAEPGLAASGATALALANVDGGEDVDLDLAVGDQTGTVTIWTNQDGCFTQVQTHSFSNPIEDLAWGNLNDDKLPELAVALRADDVTAQGLARSLVLFNEAGRLRACEENALDSCWRTPTAADTHAVRWGDVDGDGDLDLAVGNRGVAPNAVYLNQDGVLADEAGWQDSITHETAALKWGDMDGDGDLELVAALYAEPDLYYANVGGPFDPDASYTRNAIGAAAPGPAVPLAQSLALGDFDNDDDLDLAIGYAGHSGCTATQVASINGVQNQLVGPGASAGLVARPFNQFRRFLSEAQNYIPGFFVSRQDVIQFVDLLHCWTDRPNIILANEAGQLTDEPVWQSASSLATTAIAWGDVDADGRLDLVTGNVNGVIELYLNGADGLPDTPSCTARRTIRLTLNGEPSNFYALEARLSDAALSSIALADINQDGYLDLAAGIADGANRLYTFVPQIACLARAPWQPDPDPTYTVAWGDVDNDGDLDLAVGNSGSERTGDLRNRDYLYLNDRGQLQDVPFQVVGQRLVDSALVTDTIRGFPTRGLAWGDVDGDGDLDLAAASWSAQKFVYRNAGGYLLPTPAWASADSDHATALAWLDADGDGDLDLATANVTLFDAGTRNDLYLNRGGQLSATPDWQSDSTAQSLSMAWGDLDQDGRNDLLFGNQVAPLEFIAGQTAPLEVYTGRQAGDLPFSVRSGLLAPAVAQAPDSEISSMDGAAATTLFAPADYFAVPHIRAGDVISIPYRLVSPGDRPYHAVRGYYSANGVDWRPAQAATIGAEPASMPCGLASGDHLFPWVTAAEDVAFFGQSDSVVFRLEAIPCRQPMANEVAGTYQWAQVNAGTYPFRVRGTQIRVVDEAGEPVKDALVYRRPSVGIEAAPIASDLGGAYRTDENGYLQGFGTLQDGEDLFALWRAQTIADPMSAELYYTSGAPRKDGVTFSSLDASGVHTLTVSSANPLVLFNLDVALEWDASADNEFLFAMERAVREASAVLYDVTNGQMALGGVHLYHDKERWDDAHVVIYASNGIRPRATMGGIINRTQLSDTMKTGETVADAFVRGQVRMGPNWDPFGQSQSDLTQDWWRALAHEFGHYLLFLPDNYVGVDDDGFYKATDCVGSLMTYAYDDERYDEFLPSADHAWAGDCLDTVAARLLSGRTDWETITTFYPMLSAQPYNSGPENLPLAVTTLQSFPPLPWPTNLGFASDGSPVLPTRRYDLRDAESQRLEQLQQADIYLYKLGRRLQSGGPALDLSQLQQEQPVYDVLALGSTGSNRDSIVVRGAARGDRVCVFDSNHEPPRTGCTFVDGRNTAVDLRAVPGWQPEIRVTPISSDTTGVRLAIEVRQPLSATERLEAQVLPAGGPAVLVAAQARAIPATGTVSATAALPTLALPLVTLSPVPTATEDGLAMLWRGEVTAPHPSYSGFVRVWTPILQDKARREALTQYFFSREWGPASINLDPSAGRGMDPSAGRGMDPSAGRGMDPSAGRGMDPSAGRGMDPSAGRGMDPSAGRGMDPSAGRGMDPSAGRGMDPSAGRGMDPSAGRGMDPSAGRGMDPSAGRGMDPSAGRGMDPTQARSLGSNYRMMEAPISSGDGKLSIYNLTNYLVGPGPSTIQSLSALSDLPPWLTQVGHGYRVNLQNPIDGTVAFQYIQRDTPPGFEHTLAIYFKADIEGATWQRLETALDQRENTASARMPERARGNGSYALVATLELPALQEGWNLLSYPLPVRTPMTTALSSIAPSYTIAYEYDETLVTGGSDQPSPWRAYVPGYAVDDALAAARAGTLEDAHFGRTYLIYATDVVTPYLPVEVSAVITELVASVRVPEVVAVPALVAGTASRVASDPATGTVVARIGAAECGRAPAMLAGEQWQWTIQVAPDAVVRGCGARDTSVEFWLEPDGASGKSRQLGTIDWDNTVLSVLNAQE